MKDNNQLKVSISEYLLKLIALRSQATTSKYTIAREIRRQLNTNHTQYYVSTDVDNSTKVYLVNDLLTTLTLAMKNMDCVVVQIILDYGFDWEKSPEGVEFWTMVMNYLITNNSGSDLESFDEAAHLQILLT